MVSLKLSVQSNTILGRLFSPLDLTGVAAFYDPSDTSTLFQDAGGTTPVSSAGDPVGLVLDKSGNDNHLTAPSDAARPVYAVSESGDKLLQSDEVDDELSVTLPDLGTDVTIAYTTQSELRINEGETVGAGEYTLPQVDLLNYLMIDRQLTKSEKIELIKYLSRSAEGVNYGAVIDDMILACLNAVDVFVYDTTKDSDGGAWRTGSLAKASSWYNEELNTATRGSRREFPAVAVIVAESNKVTIYDGDDPALPMWMVFNNGSVVPLWNGTTVTSVHFANGKCVIGQAATTGVAIFDMLSDEYFSRRNNTTRYSFTNILGRNGSSVVATSTFFSDPLVNAAVNDVAMTVLPDAPIDPATGLPVPTIAVATGGGVSVIKDDGTVVDITFVATRNFVDTVSFTADNWILATTSNVTNPAGWFPVIFEIPASGNTNVGASTGGNGVGFQSILLPPVGTSAFEAGTAAHSSAETLFIGKPSGLWQLPAVPDDALAVSQKNLVSHTTSTYNTGWMNGDIKGAFLSGTDDADLVGGTDADRSVNGNDLTVNGTVTRSPVATGAELVAYSGFSASNYLEQPYNSDLDFGTGDFCVMGWVKPVSVNADYIFDCRDQTVLPTGFFIYINGSGQPTLYTQSSGATTFVTSSQALSVGQWQHVVGFRKSGVNYIYLNGVLTGTASGATQNVNNTNRKLIVGNSIGVFSYHALQSSLALLRISATAPTTEQIAKIYEDEKVLFQENAACTLYGASDAVTALAHDPDTDLLHVGTSDGRSVFRGLERIQNTTTSVSKAISASGGLVAEK